MKSATNSSGKKIDYLRVSITDRCNLRCIYCMPPEGLIPAPHESILTYEEICELVKIGVQCGIQKVRVTGGEPLVRRNVIGFITSLGRIDGLQEISMTTNGVLLSDFAQDLKAAGIGRINISLDTLQADTFKKITRRDDLAAVLKGIDTVLHMGFEPVKINVVAMKGLNDDEIATFGELSIDRPLHIRFIEFMHIGRMIPENNAFFFPADAIQGRLETVDKLMSINSIQGNGPARYFSYPKAMGTVGLISPLTNGFCQACNRLRLTADGRLRPCLLSDVEIDAKSVLRSNGNDEALRKVFQQAVGLKTYGHHQKRSQNRYMRSIGG